MKTHLLLTLAAILSVTLHAADAKTEVTDAAKKLSETSYSWNTTVKVPENAQFRPGPSEGQADKEGLTYLKSTFGDNTTETFLKGEKGALKTGDAGWRSLSELENEEGRIRFTARLMKNFRAPAVQAKELAGYAKELKKEGDSYSGDLTEEGVKNYLTFRRGGDATVANPKGSVKFTVKNGDLTRFEYWVKGTVNFNGNDFESDRTTITEIKNVGTTKLQVPEEAKKKL